MACANTTTNAVNDVVDGKWCAKDKRPIERDQQCEAPLCETYAWNTTRFGCATLTLTLTLTLTTRFGCQKKY